MTAPLPRFLVWLRDFAGVPTAQLFYEADKSGTAPLLTVTEDKAKICFFPIASDMAHLPFGDLASEYNWRTADMVRTSPAAS